MEDCLKTDGNNTTPLHHMNKGMLRRQGRLPVSISVSPTLADNSDAASSSSSSDS